MVPDGCESMNHTQTTSTTKTTNTTKTKTSKWYQVLNRNLPIPLL